MKIADLIEGKMKDLAYRIQYDGEKNPFEKTVGTAHAAQLNALCKKSGKALSVVQAEWDRAKLSAGDPRDRAYWARVTKLTKIAIGLE